MMEPEGNYYFTFMQKQVDKRNKYVKIFGTSHSAREKMVELFGEQWAFQYNEKDFIPQIDMYRLSELKL